MLLVKHCTFSAYESFHCIDTSTVVPSFSPIAWKIFGCSTDFVRFMYSTKPLTPPEYAKFSLLPSRWSISSIFVPLLRNDSSRMRLARMSKWYSTRPNVSRDAMKCTSVPRRSDGPTSASGDTATPRRNSIW